MKLGQVFVIGLALALFGAGCCGPATFFAVRNESPENVQVQVAGSDSSPGSWTTIAPGEKHSVGSFWKYQPSARVVIRYGKGKSTTIPVDVHNGQKDVDLRWTGTALTPDR